MSTTRAEGGAWAVDHVVLRLPDRDGFVTALAQAAGLSPRVGYAPGGEVASRGVRFANGVFLDVFAAPEPSAALILGAPIEDVAAQAEARGWAFRLLGEGESPEPGYDPPWSMLLFRRGQGLLTGISVIDYAPRGSARWAQADFAGELYDPALRDAPSLARVWLGCADFEVAADQLQGLGYAPAGEVVSAFPPGTGRRFRGPGADLVLCEGADAVLRLDIEGVEGAERELVVPGAPRMVLGA
jgi:hypothetical protein